MKKLVLVFALALTFGIAATNVSANEKEDKKKEVKKEAKADCATKAENSEKTVKAAGCGEAQKKSCGEAAKSCCGSAKKTEKK